MQCDVMCASFSDVAASDFQPLILPFHSYPFTTSTAPEMAAAKRIAKEMKVNTRFTSQANCICW
jgi:hypothetical protein